MEAPLHAHILILEQPPDLLDALLEAGPALVEGASESSELVRQKGASEAHVEAARRDRVEHADLPGQLERIVEDR